MGGCTMWQALGELHLGPHPCWWVMLVALQGTLGRSSPANLPGTAWHQQRLELPASSRGGGAKACYTMLGGQVANRFASTQHPMEQLRRPRITHAWTMASTGRLCLGPVGLDCISQAL